MFMIFYASVYHEKWMSLTVSLNMAGQVLNFFLIDKNGHNGGGSIDLRLDWHESQSGLIIWVGISIQILRPMIK